MQQPYWQVGYPTEYRALDEQHQEIDEKIGALEALLSGPESARAAALIADFRNRLEEHFLLEQRVMTTCKYPGLSHHVDVHDFIIRNVEVVTQMFSGEAMVDARARIVAHLQESLREDVAVDAAFKEFLDRRVGISALRA